MVNMPSNYRRKRKRTSKKTFSPVDIGRTKDFNVESSWFNQHETIEKEAGSAMSASHKKIYEYLDDSSDDSDTDESEAEDETTSVCCWIMDLESLIDGIRNTCVCKCCHNNINLVEMSNARAGLGTKFVVKCENAECVSQTTGGNEFSTSRKDGQIYEVNRKCFG